MDPKERLLWPSGNGIFWTFLLLSLPLFAVSFLAAGFGDGTFIPMLVLNPWAALGGHLTDSGFGALVGGLLELPVYGLCLELSKRHGHLGFGVAGVVAVHSVAMAAAAKVIW